MEKSTRKLLLLLVIIARRVGKKLKNQNHDPRDRVGLGSNRSHISGIRPGSGRIPPSRARHASPSRMHTPQFLTQHRFVLASPLIVPPYRARCTTDISKSKHHEMAAGKSAGGIGPFELEKAIPTSLVHPPASLRHSACQRYFALVYLVQRLRPSNCVRMGRQVGWYRMPLISDWSHKNPPAWQTSWNSNSLI
jgi:hypothetical protein